VVRGVLSLPHSKSQGAYATALPELRSLRGLNRCYQRTPPFGAANVISQAIFNSTNILKKKAFLGLDVWNDYGVQLN
jgi:hypothetical protein